MVVVKRAIDIVAERMRPKKEEVERGSDEEEEDVKEEEEPEITPNTLKARVQQHVD